jgi:hypothetical protein
MNQKDSKTNKQESQRIKMKQNESLKKGFFAGEASACDKSERGKNPNETMLHICRISSPVGRGMAVRSEF